MRDKVPDACARCSVGSADPADGATSAFSRPGRAVDDGELRSPQAAVNEIVKQRAPGRLAFPAHVLHGQQHLLPIRRRRAR